MADQTQSGESGSRKLDRTYRLVRRMVLWLALGGICLYAVGEATEIDWAVQLGIWAFVAGLALAILARPIVWLRGFMDF